MPSEDHRLMALLGHGHKVSDRPPSARRSPVLWGMAVVVAVAAVFWALGARESTIPAASDAAAAGVADKNALRWWNHPGLGAHEASKVEEPPVAEAPEPVPVAPQASKPGLFQLDATGQLALDERTRLGVESLVALTAPEQMPAALEAHVQGLPPEAAAAAREFVGRFESYVDAQKNTYPPGRAPLVPEEGLAELAGLQALRESYFGREASQRMYGEEDAVARRLLELMREDPVPDAPMEIKAMRAQARYDAERDGGGGSALPR
ncbi:hypothetical protein [Hydrogenophaga sp.]|uniref:hypothetical protein n=1 Tax=Hydrogenophaga sp. TaxID=1904254 RepID=UPI00271643FB|nr:hypothetical protein [Hydrogenophaga sp.]MDO8905165.1 hypothetical protein [Hydrogenophaga sp.]